MTKKRGAKAEKVEEATIPEIVEEPAAVSPEPEPKEELPKVGIEVFAASGSTKMDQLAGFAAHAFKNKLAPRTIPEWRQTLKEFHERPVKRSSFR